jgi:hypothetical protein
MPMLLILLAQSLADRRAVVALTLALIAIVAVLAPSTRSDEGHPAGMAALTPPLD